MKAKNSILALSIIGLLAFCIYNSLSKPKIACVQLGKLYDEFEMKKQLEGKFKNITNLRKLQLDSMELELKALANVINGLKENDPERMKRITDFELKRETFMQKKNSYTEDNNGTSKMYDEQVWTQINQYVGEFAKENKYTCIMGANGTGAVMYADLSIDITEELSKYINLKYKGIAK